MQQTIAYHDAIKLLRNTSGNSEQLGGFLLWLRDTESQNLHVQAMGTAQLYPAVAIGSQKVVCVGRRRHYCIT